MAENWLEDWEERVRAIAASLLTLEVNTVVKNGMSAQKMPEVPVALHAIVQVYAGFVRALGFPVTPWVLGHAAGRITNYDGHSEAHQLALIEFSKGAPHDEAEYHDTSTDDLTNGSETFEALVWVSARARNMQAAETIARRDQLSDLQVKRRQSDAALLSRVQANCRQLREVALLLEARFPPESLTPPAQAPGASLPMPSRLTALAANGPDQGGPRPARLFGGTLGQTTQALFQHPRPVLTIEPDIAVLVRKAWDIGLEEVRFQTVIQIDGDVLVRATDIDDGATRAFLQELHRTAVNDGLQQWRLLFVVAGDLMKTVGEWLFGPRKAAG